MKFKGNGMIWNPSTGSALVVFDAVTGEYETDDPAIIAELEKRGIFPVQDAEVVEDAKIEEISQDAKVPDVKSDENQALSQTGSNISQEFEELRNWAKETGVPDYLMKTKAELEELFINAK